MRRAISLAHRVADTRSTVLITGETGTGKELVANLIHASSGRRLGPLLKLSCSALPEALLESELFGHEAGAFTGAVGLRRGRFEQASGGTLFFDEIGELSSTTQAKLLRVLQDQEFYRLGGVTPIRTDARIIAASQHDLEAAVRSGAFREDLYFRLSVIDIRVPPLRERPEDAIALAESFLRYFELRAGRPPSALSAEVARQVSRYAWPGNVRELRNLVERHVMLAGASGSPLESLGLAPEASENESGLAIEIPEAGVSLAAVERDLVRAALRRSDFVQKDAAALLGISRRKLNYMIRQMGLTHPSWRRNRRSTTVAAGPRSKATPSCPSALNPCKNSDS